MVLRPTSWVLVSVPEAANTSGLGMPPGATAMASVDRPPSLPPAVASSMPDFPTPEDKVVYIPSFSVAYTLRPSGWELVARAHLWVHEGAEQGWEMELQCHSQAAWETCLLLRPPSH